MENLLVVDGLSLQSILAVLPISLLVLLLPGLLLMSMLVERREPWLVKLPVSIVLSIGLSIILSTLVLAGKMALAWLLIMLAGVSTVAGILLFSKHRRHQGGEPLQESAGRVNFVLLGAFLLATAFAIWHFILPIDRFAISEDFWSYLSFVRKWATLGPRPAVEVQLGTPADTFRYMFGGWMLVQSLLSVFSGVDPIDISAWWLPAILMITSYLSHYAFAHTLFRNRNAAMLASLVEILSLGVYASGRDSLGQVFFSRINEDKFLLTFVLLPIALFFMLRYLRDKRWENVVGFLIMAIALPLTHPLGLVELGLSFGLFAIVHLLLNGDKETLQRFSLVITFLLVLLAIPLAERSIATKPYVVGDEEGFALYERMHRTRLMVLDAENNLYMLHPKMVSSPLTIAGLVLAPLLLLFARKEIAARFLFGNSLGLSLLLGVPWLAPLLGRIITPWMLWRLVYILPTALTLGYLLEKLLAATVSLMRRLRLPDALAGALPPLLLIGTALILRSRGMLLWPSPPKEKAYEQEADLLLAAQEIILEPSVIMCTMPMQHLLPAFLQQGFVPTWLRNNPVDDKVIAFYEAPILDATAWSTLSTYNCTYLIADSNRSTHLYLPSELLTPLYANARYALFQVNPAPVEHPLIAGNTLFEADLWDESLAAYRQAEESSPLYARLQQAEIMRKQGKIDEARAALERLIAEHPSDPWPYLYLGNLDRLHGEPEKALRSYLAAFSEASQGALLPASISRGLQVLAGEGLGELTTIPDEEHERWGVSFIRGQGKLGDYDLASLRLGWYSDWAVGIEAGLGIEHVQTIMVSPEAWPPNWSRIEDALANQPGSIWLVGMWPEWEAAGNLTPQAYAEIYHEAYTYIKRRDIAALVAPGGIVQPSPARLQWLDAVLDAYETRYHERLPADAWHINAYILREERGSWGAGLPVGLDLARGELFEIADNVSAEVFKQHVEDFRQWMAARGERSKPLIISGYGVQMPSEYLGDGDAALGEQRIVDFMTQTFDYLANAHDDALGYPADNDHLVQRWLWYSLNARLLDSETGAVSNGMLYLQGDPNEPLSLTLFGEAFARYMGDVP